MQRSTRLIDLIQILRDGKLHRAHDLARRQGVSVRTIYRDMEALMLSGVPVEGERGAGYQMTAPITLPPLNLTLAELEALHLGLAVVGEADDPDLKAAAASVSAKIDAVLPEDRQTSPNAFGFAIYPFADAARGFLFMPRIRAAIRARQKLQLRLDGEDQDRVLRPLKLDYWGRVWTVTAWCDTTGGFLSARLDRIESLAVMPALFVDEPGKTLGDQQSS